MHATRSPQETFDLGKSFATQLRPGDVVTLTGNLGSGKTQFVVGVCKGLEVRDHVASPTFTIINEYGASFGKVAHIDLYRIAKRAEVDELGIEEYFNETCICLIEWPELIADIIPPAHWVVRISHGATETARLIAIKKVGAE